jgi:replicative DNA helicase
MNTLLEYGSLFQEKVIANLLTKKPFLEQIYDILDPKYFESEAHNWIICKIKDYYSDYREMMPLTSFKVKLTEIDNDVLKTAIVEELKEVKKYLYANDLPFVEQEFRNFCKLQTFKTALIKSTDLLKEGKFDDILSLFKKAHTAGTEVGLGHDYKKDLAKRLHKEARKTIPTGFTVLDELMDGGLASGELGIIAAPPGIGKSWALINFGRKAMELGLSVIHFTLELNENYLGLRYDSNLTGHSANNLKYHEGEIAIKIESLPGNSFIEYFPTKSASVETLIATVNKYKLLGVNIDLIIVDYGDILKADVKTSNGNSYNDIGGIYEDLRRMAGEFQVPVWTASQINRSAAEDEVITGDKLAESYKKLMIADFLVTISRKIEDKLQNTARWHIVKNRFGQDGVTLPAKMNTMNGRTELFSPSSPEGKQTKKQMKNADEVTRKMLREKYNDLKDEDLKGFS